MIILKADKLNKAIATFGTKATNLKAEGHKLLCSAAFHCIGFGNSDPLNTLLTVAEYQGQSMARWLVVNKLATLVPANKKTGKAAYYKANAEARALFCEDNKPKDAAVLIDHIEAFEPFYELTKPVTAFKGASFKKDLAALIKRYETFKTDEEKDQTKIDYTGHTDLSLWATANVLAN